MGRKNILLADGEPVIRKNVAEYLHREGFYVEQAVDGAEALALFEKQYWDFVVLDSRLPGMDGLKVCKEIRKTSQIPVIMLTPLNENDRILGLEMGADDCLSKPFSPRELVARIKAILRRMTSTHPAKKTVFHYSGLKIDLLTRTVTVSNHKISLTPREFDLLALLSRNAGQVFTRELLLDEIWGEGFFGDVRIVDTHIKRLREKFKSLNISSNISTVWGVGYKFEVK